MAFDGIFDGSPRERNLLIGMGAVVLGGLLWFLLSLGGNDTAPVADTREDALRDLQIVQTALANRPVTTVASGPREPFTRSTLIRGAQTAQLTISRVEPGADDSITVTFDATEPARVLGFMTDMADTTTAVFSAFEIESVDNGQVESRVTLRPAN